MPKHGNNNKKKHPLLHFISGGCAGLVECSICHPLDTIKTWMQLQKKQQQEKMTMMDHHRVAHNKHSLLRTTEPAALLAPPPIRNNSSCIGTSTSSTCSSISSSSSSGSSSIMTTRTAPLSPSSSSSTTLIQQQQPIKKSRTIVTTATTTGTGGGGGPIDTARRIIQREGFCALYKGLTAVYTGIIPKMAIRFLSFEQYRETLGSFVLHRSQQQQPQGGWRNRRRHSVVATSTATTTSLVHPTHINFLAGLASGLTEAIMVVTPAEVCKIRMQSQCNNHQNHHPATTLPRPQQSNHNNKYRNVFQTATVIVREEGVSALYKGILPTMLRQGCNQAVNFTMYNTLKQTLLSRRRHHSQQQHSSSSELQPWQTLVIGGVSGGMGPMLNNPLDVVKTRMQQQVISPNQPAKYTGIFQAMVVIVTTEGGVSALWKGITPRLLRIVPGQAITFVTYEAVSSTITKRFSLGN